MRLFRWLSAKPVSPCFDLRRFGWQLVEGSEVDEAARRCPVLALVDRHAQPNWGELGEWRFSPLRGLILLIGVDDHDARARLLRHGFGDVTGSCTRLHEIEARATRIAAQSLALPRLRRFGQLQLDLFARDGFVREQRLGLHPREFALIWRLSDTPGKAVAKRALIQDIWRMAFVPETNSLAVHVYRLRAKLASVGLQAMVRTTADGSYCFDPGIESRTALPLSLAAGGNDDDPQLALSVIQGFGKEPPP